MSGNGMGQGDLQQRAQAAYDLICDHIKNDNLDEAQRTWEAMNAYGDDVVVTVSLAKAARALVLAYGRHNRLDAAMVLLPKIHDLSGLPAIQNIHALAVIGLLTTFLSADHPSFDKQSALLAMINKLHPDTFSAAAQAFYDNILICCHRNKMVAAEALLEFMSSVCREGPQKLIRARAAAAVVLKLLSSGRQPEEIRIPMLILKNQGDSEPYRKVQAEIAFRKIDALIQKGTPLAARPVFEELMSLHGSNEINQIKNRARTLLVAAGVPLIDSALLLIPTNKQKRDEERQARVRADHFRIQEQAQNKSEDLFLRVDKASSQLPLISMAAVGGNYSQALALYEEMSDWGNEPEMQFERACALVDVIAAYCQAGRPDEGRKLLGRIKFLGRTEEITSRVAVCFHNLIATYAFAGRFNEAKNLFDEMKMIGKTDTLMLACAEAAEVLLAAYHAAGRPGWALALFIAMDDLGKSEGVRIVRAECGVNVVAESLKAGHIADAQTALAVYNRLGDSDAVAVERAKATANMITAQCQSGQSDKAKTMLQSVLEHDCPIEARKIYTFLQLQLASSFAQSGQINEGLALFQRVVVPDKAEELGLFRAMTASNLLLDLCDAKRLTEATELLQEIRKKCGDSLQVRGICAESTRNVMAHWGLMGDIPTAQTLFQTMANLGEDVIIRRERAIALFNLIELHKLSGNLDEGIKLLRTSANPGEVYGVREFGIKSAMNLILALRDVNRLDDAWGVLGIMRQLCGGDEDFRKECADAIINLIAAYGRAGELQTAQALLDSIEELGNEESIRLMRTKGACNMVFAYHNVGRLDEALTVVMSMWEWGDSPEIQELRTEITSNLAEDFHAVGRNKEAETLLAILRRH